MNFRTNEYVGKAVPNVIANSQSEILHEVIAAGVEGASAGRSATGGGIGEIETVAGNADPGKKIEADFLSNLRLKERIDVAQERTVSFATDRVVSLIVPPGGFNVEAEVMFEANIIAACVDVSATSFGRRAKHGCGSRGR